MCTFYYKEKISQKCLRCLLHKSVFFCLFNSGLEPIPAVTLGTLWTDLQPTAGLTQIDRQPFALTFKPTADLESPFNLSYTCFWTERQEKPERSLTIMGKLSKLHTERTHWLNLNPRLSWCGAGLLNTAPPCHPPASIGNISRSINIYGRSLCYPHIKHKVKWSQLN